MIISKILVGIISSFLSFFIVISALINVFLSFSHLALFSDFVFFLNYLSKSLYPPVYFILLIILIILINQVDRLHRLNLVAFFYKCILFLFIVSDSFSKIINSYQRALSMDLWQVLKVNSLLSI